MSVREVVIYSQGLGRQPEAQYELAQNWGEQFDIEVIHRQTNWRQDVRNDDYNDHLQETGEIIKSLAKPDVFIYAMGSSGGGIETRSLLLRYPQLIQAAALINVKPSCRYDFSQEPELPLMFPGLEMSTDTLEADLAKFGPEDPDKILWVNSRTDERIDRVDEGKVLKDAKIHTMDIDGHVEGIEHAITVDAPIIVNFFRKRSGILIHNG